MTDASPCEPPARRATTSSRRSRSASGSRTTRPITLVDYDPALAGPVRARGGANSGGARRHASVRLEHTGSTSVPGLAAKPIIDITLIVPDSADEADLRAAARGRRATSSGSGSRTGTSTGS